MTLQLTPGVYIQPVQPARATGPLARGDVPVFLGYAMRGPPQVAVRVESLRQFADIFGDPYRPGHLSGAVKAFFETGGVVCYVMRITGQGATGAVAELIPDPAAAASMFWRARASFPWPRINPRVMQGNDNPGAQAWAAAFDTQVREHGRRTVDPGVWADGLRVEVSRRSLVSTQTEPGRIEDGFASQVFNQAGLEPHSILELHQEIGGVAISAAVEVARIDSVRHRVWWTVPPETLATAGPAFDPTRPIRIASVEFRVDVMLDGRLAERFDHLSPHPLHSRSLLAVIEEQCRNLDLTPAFAVTADTDWADPATWPAIVAVTLSGGRDAVSGVVGQDYLSALENQARNEEIALIAAPDLVLAEAAPEVVAAPTPPPGPDCTVLQAPPNGLVTGQVVASGLAGGVKPLPGVRVEAAGSGKVSQTDAAGLFKITGLAMELVTLEFSKPGFADVETLALAVEFAPATPDLFTMAALTAPRRLSDTEILTVQQAMMNPAVAGPYRVAIIDPPSAEMKLDALRSWRAKLGDSQRGAFVVPWVKAPLLDRPGTAQQPPSGHVCGALAGAERETGLHRSPANRQLRHIDGICLEIGDAEQGLLNPAGINAIRAFPGRGSGSGVRAPCPPIPNGVSSPRAG